jgi:hypothetical protein
LVSVIVVMTSPSVPADAREPAPRRSEALVDPAEDFPRRKSA